MDFGVALAHQFERGGKRRSEHGSRQRRLHLQHRIVIDATAGWAWNGIEDAPTFTPSILVQGGSSGIRCHSFITDGSWRFLSDSTHALSGQTVPMAPIPDHMLALIGAF